MRVKIHLYLIALFVHCFNGFEIEIEVTSVPKYYTPINDIIYITGSFNEWNPKGLALNKILNRYNAKFNLSDGIYEYKFTRGSWETVEVSLDGSDLLNRTLVVANRNVLVELNIENWMDMKGKHTAIGNVFCLDSSFPYNQFNRTKRIWIYLPPDYFTLNKHYPVIYMSDGHNAFDTYFSTSGIEWKIDETFERLWNEGREVPIVVGLETAVDNGQRDLELPIYPNRVRGGGKGDLYAEFIINEVKPYIDSHFRTLSNRENTAVIGASLGGYSSLYMGLEYQDVFSKIGIFSPAYWYNREIFKYVDKTSRKYNDTKIHMIVGGKENNRNYVMDFVKMENILIEKGFDKLNSIIEFNSSHSEYFWSRQFPDAFEYLFN